MNSCRYGVLTTYESSWFLKREQDPQGLHLISRRVALNWDKSCKEDPLLAKINLRTALFQVCMLCLDNNEAFYTSANSPAVITDNKLAFKNNTPGPRDSLSWDKRHKLLNLSERYLATTIVFKDFLCRINGGQVYSGNLIAEFVRFRRMLPLLLVPHEMKQN